MVFIARVIREVAKKVTGQSPAELLPKKDGGACTMPLTMSKVGESNIIKKIGGREETKKFLESLGFVIGSTVTIVSDIGGNLIVNIKESRVAVSKEMALKILV